MSHSEPERETSATGNTALIRKVSWTAFLGFVTFAGSALLDDALHVSLADQLVMATIVGGVTLLVQYLSDFDQTLRSVRAKQQDTFESYQVRADQGFAGIESTLHAKFAGVSEAAELMDSLQRSALPKQSIAHLVRVAGLMTESSGPLALALAEDTIRYALATLRALAEEDEVFYNGEDRELLLGLATHSASQIRATSWATTSARGQEFEAGFWFTDLGGRYLDAQRAAVQRGVRIRRVFIYDSIEAVSGPEFRQIRDMQRNAGVEVKVLSSAPLPADGSVTDFVMFDDEVSYETAPLARGMRSAWLVNTRLVFVEEAVRRRSQLFEEVWAMAEEPAELAHIDLVTVAEDVADAVHDVGREN